MPESLGLGHILFFLLIFFFASEGGGFGAVPAHSPTAVETGTRPQSAGMLLVPCRAWVLLKRHSGHSEQYGTEIKSSTARHSGHLKADENMKITYLMTARNVHVQLSIAHMDS